jgi:hypothetical protein
MKKQLAQLVGQGKNIEEIKINMLVMVQSVIAQDQEELLYLLNQKNHHARQLVLTSQNNIHFTY